MKIIILSLAIASISSIIRADEKTVTFKAVNVNLIVPDSLDDFVFKGDDNVTRHTPRISNGRQAGEAQFPFVAELSINTQDAGYLCSGSLIARNWILSARHCIADTNARSVLAQLGSVNRQSSQRVRIFASLFIWMNVNDGNHPDIALFKLYNDAPDNSNVRAIRLPSLSQENNGFERVTATAIGWGGVGGGRFSQYLQYTQFTILTRGQCNLGEYLICSQPPSGSSSSLEGGDSGGPMIIYENGTPTLIGVNVLVAWAGTSKWQGTTRVSSFLRFIHDSTGIPYR